MRQALIAGHPDRAFGTELVSDCLDRHVDFVHTATFGASPAPDSVPEVFRYTFPEILLSSRELRDETDYVRRMNWTFLYGWRFDVEIWRCRGDLRQAPAYGAYMAKLIALRNRWPELLMTGKFVDEEFFTFDRPGFMAKGYIGGGRAAIIAWNLTAKEQRFTPQAARAAPFPRRCHRDRPLPPRRPVARPVRGRVGVRLGCWVTQCFATIDKIARRVAPGRKMDVPMPWYDVIWNYEPRGNVEHVAEHGLNSGRGGRSDLQSSGEENQPQFGSACGDRLHSGWATHSGCLRGIR